MKRSELKNVYESKRKADLIIQGGTLVNVLSKEMYQADVAIVEDRIISTGDVSSYKGPETEIFDATG
ncbi:MAG: hypothetical protein PQJ48_12695, partial [Sphaerochaetaceae bacterium]|nr:hypothetical protein [Sphaerochaetaceae bacterium]